MTDWLRRCAVACRLIAAVAVLSAVIGFPSSWAADDAELETELKAELKAEPTGPVELLATAEEGYGRIVLNWSVPFEYEADVTNGILIVSIAEPFDIELKDLANDLDEYIIVARQDLDRRTIRIALHDMFDLVSNQVGSKLYLDLLSPGWSGDPPPLPPVIEAEQKDADIEDIGALDLLDEDELDAGVISDEDFDPANLPVLNIRASEHPQFSRVVFDWERPVGYEVKQFGDEIIITFSRPARPDLQRLRVAPPPYLFGAEANITPRALELRLHIDTAMKVRDFREGTTVVLDVSPLGPQAALSEQIIKDVDEGNEMVDVSAPEQPELISAVDPDDESTQAHDGEKPPIKTAALDTSPSEVESQLAAPEELSSENQEELPSENEIDEVQKEEGQKDKETMDSANMDSANDVDAVVSDIESTSESVPVEGASGDSAIVGENPETDVVESAPEVLTPDGLVNESPQPSDGTASLPPVLERQVDEDLGPLVSATVEDVGSGLRLLFPWPDQVGATVFQRGSDLWVLFDARNPIDLTAIDRDANQWIERIDRQRMEDATLLRIRLRQRALVTATAKNRTWIVTLSDVVAEPALPITLDRSVNALATGSVVFNFPGATKAHWLDDPQIGGRFAFITGYGPAHNLLAARKFVEFTALGTAQGLVIRPSTDDLQLEVGEGQVTVLRDGGLTLSMPGQLGVMALAGDPSDDRARLHPHGRPERPGRIEFERWSRGGPADFHADRKKLQRAVIDTAFELRPSARFELARFLVAHRFGFEALGVLNYIAGDDPAALKDPAFLALRGVANYCAGRHHDAIADLTHKDLLFDADAALWRGITYTELMKWKEAQTAFKVGEDEIRSYPAEWEALIRIRMAQAAFALKDTVMVAYQLDNLPDTKLPPALRNEVTLMQGRLFENQGKTKEAIAEFDRTANASYRPISVPARVARLALKLKTGQVDDQAAINELEQLRFQWRGDDTELKVLSLLGQLHLNRGEYREGLSVMRTAVLFFGRTDNGRQASTEMRDAFEGIFLNADVQKMPPLEALGLYYDFRDLTPLGRRGDEMIRRLAERLVKVDLLPQAASLLDHQVENRLRGVARAQVAKRLAEVYLLDKNPKEALDAIRKTRQTMLPDGLAEARRLLEAKALTMLGSHDKALELVSGGLSEGAQILRADILWNAENWLKAGRSLESLLGSDWSEGSKLAEVGRVRVLRAAIAYALAGDGPSLNRLRMKFGGQMQDSDQAEAFMLIAHGGDDGDVAFRDLAKQIADVETLDTFMTRLRAGTLVQSGHAIN